MATNKGSCSGLSTQNIVTVLFSISDIQSMVGPGQLSGLSSLLYWLVKKDPLSGSEKACCLLVISGFLVPLNALSRQLPGICHLGIEFHTILMEIHSDSCLLKT